MTRDEIRALPAVTLTEQLADELRLVNEIILQVGLVSSYSVRGRQWTSRNMAELLAWRDKILVLIENESDDDSDGIALAAFFPPR